MLSELELRIDDPKWEGYSLWKYVKQTIPYYTKLLIIKELRLKKILVNGQSSFFQYKLQLGDKIYILVLPEKDSLRPFKSTTSYLEKRQNFKGVSVKDQIIFENQHLLIVNKKEGQIVQADPSSSSPSLEEIVQSNYKTSEGLEYLPKFVHRLDRPVRGLLLAAKSAKAHNLLSEALRNHSLKKVYRALVIGKWDSKVQELEHWILDKGKRVTVYQKTVPDSKYSKLLVKRLKVFSNSSYLEIELITGRKNQIRAQLGWAGHPILGDRKYYSKEIKKNFKEELNREKKGGWNPKKIALVSYQIVFPEYLVSELELPKSSFSLPKDRLV
ncbi:putative pseudouridine synthase [Candidatus Mycoplasma haematolamae str. Purdue]|uniref:RNA pseudouridylate synthase n=1 Tax=Mycoplasma haematolamae (strain Purdue) TaxID=1212765 RepID=I7CEL1_MYCHA|nr:RNA pseudouridine synthase [Candidatus Mycoplasma haematolamae]AFO51681.1 putative pseudouridine synthase [Candidatus Mycoplasma haematolamae str. Purdue]